MKLLVCSFVILATVCAQGSGSASYADVEGGNATAVEDFERCFVYNRIPKPKFMKEKVGALDFDECRMKCDEEKECLYFQWRNNKCFKYIVEDRPRKKFVYGLAFCNEPGVPADNAPPCMEQKGDPITRTKKYNEVGYPVDCANMCEMDTRCILWAWDKKVLTCKITLLKANRKTAAFSMFDRNYCNYYADADADQA